MQCLQQVEAVQVVGHVHQSRISLRRRHGAFVRGRRKSELQTAKPPARRFVVQRQRAGSGQRQERPTKVHGRVESVARRSQQNDGAFRDLKVQPWPGGQRGESVALPRRDLARPQRVAQRGGHQDVLRRPCGEATLGVRLHTPGATPSCARVGSPAQGVPAPALDPDHQTREPCRHRPAIPVALQHAHGTHLKRLEQQAEKQRARGDHDQCADGRGRALRGHRTPIASAFKAPRPHQREHPRDEQRARREVHRQHPSHEARPPHTPPERCSV